MSWKCENCEAFNDEIHTRCWSCKKPRFQSPGEFHTQASKGLILCSTTPEVPGREISSPLGVVFGEAILGANILRDLLAGVRDIVGGRSETYELKLKDGRKMAMQKMLDEASALGADAVVGIDLDYETVGQTMLMICVSGTAVKLKPGAEPANVSQADKGAISS